MTNENEQKELIEFLDEAFAKKTITDEDIDAMYQQHLDDGGE